MEQDSRLVDFLARLIARWADLDPPVGNDEIRTVARVRDYLDAHLSEDVGLADLARVAGLSRSHFIRVRRDGADASRLSARSPLCAARRLLERGEPPGEVAAACGFF